MSGFSKYETRSLNFLGCKNIYILGFEVIYQLSIVHLPRMLYHSSLLRWTIKAFDLNMNRFEFEFAVSTVPGSPSPF